jgi:hypothetical protein
MPTALPDDTGFLLRHRALGSEAIYRVLEEGDEIVTAEVIQAPGLARGTRVRLMARACRAMERLDHTADPITVTRRFAPPPRALDDSIVASR